MRPDKRLLGLLKDTLPDFVQSIAMGVLAALAIIGQAYLISRIIAEVFLYNSMLLDVQYLIGSLAAVSFLRYAASWQSANAGNKTAVFIKTKLRLQLFKHLKQMDTKTIKDERSGEVSNTLLNGVESLDVYFSSYLPQLFLSTLIPVLILFFVFPIDVLSGFVFLLTAPLIPVFMILIGHVANARTQKQWKTLSRMSAFFMDTLQGLTTLKILGRSKEQISHIEQVSEAFRKTTMDVLKIAFISALTLELLATLSTAIIAVEIGLRLLYAEMPFQKALFILILAPEFYQPLRQLGARFHDGMQGLHAAERIFNILNIQGHQTTNASVKKHSFNNQDDIRFEGVHVHYDGNDKPTLNNINLKLQPSETCAVVGSSGSGKSTLINLLLRFFEPDSGSIIIGNQPLEQIDVYQWREQIGWLPQKPYIFNTTLAENLRLVRASATDEEIMQALHLAHLDAFVSDLPLGINTPVGENGARLSGGQKQRLALARLFLRDTKIAVLDEPTANLDANIEREVEESLTQFMQHRTTLYVAHRLHTLRRADQIVVMADGQIVEHGSQSALLQQNGVYKQLFTAYQGSAV
ncbi:MAG: thiol reductant ABC exporter subunit CydD [Caldithrix sp.]|nr:thiol reductant ABC exporter subunit CydD [Caldithrix sp.]